MKRGERHERCFQLLVAANYRRNWEITLPAECGTLEQWIGRRGILFVQVLTFRGGDSISIAHEGGVPSKWDDIETWLTGDGRELEPRSMTPDKADALAAVERSY